MSSDNTHDLVHDSVKSLLEGFSAASRDKAFAKRLFEDPSLTDLRQMIELFKKFLDDPSQKASSLLTDSLGHLDDEPSLIEELTVCRGEIKRLRQQVFHERTTLQAILSMLDGREEGNWSFIIRIIFNINMFYKRYWVDRKGRWVSPEKWVEIMHDQLGIGDEIDKDWKQWKLFRDLEVLNKENSYIPMEIHTDNGFIRFSYDEDGCVLVTEKIKEGSEEEEFVQQ